MKLRIESKKHRKEVKIETYGPLESIEDIIDLKSFVDVKSMTNEQLQEYLGTNENDRKKIVPALLFGSHKPYGPLPTKPHKKRFSHTRVFGHRKAPFLESNSA
eukprot:scaffold7245_cov197-Ochromonas_danica.AAC.12